MMATELERALSGLLNRHCMENESNTPDWILAQYLLGCLAVFELAVRQREGWYGRPVEPGVLAGLPGVSSSVAGN